MKSIAAQELTEVGVGTVMGSMMRQYWVPAVLSSELKADAAPTRLVLLGERLIAWRDTSGRVGVMDHRCPHRGASLFLGRNEEDGIRCVYHGWKFDITGACVDQMNLPAHQMCKERVHAKAYPALEKNGLVWTYMGPRETPPPFPDIEAATLNPAEATVFMVQRECNWLQSLEGDIDTSHFGVLHMGSIDPEEVAEGNPLRYAIEDRGPAYEVSDTPWGTMYAAHRPAGDADHTYWRFAHFMFPFWSMIPNGVFEDYVSARAWVPMDDTHTMFVYMVWKKSSPGTGLLKDGSHPKGVAPFNFEENTTDWHGRWRLKETARNDYQIDRGAQARGEIFTGILNIHLQDQAVTESMGPIVDHEFETLVASDLMIARTRRRLLKAARSLRDSGTAPPGVDDPSVYRGARSGYFVENAKLSWREAYDRKLKDVVRPEATV